MANEVQQIERRQRVADRDAEIVQGTGNLHHYIGDPLFGEPKNIFDNPATLDAGNGVFDFHARTGEDPVEQFVALAECFTSGLFFGWLVSTPAGS